MRMDTHIRELLEKPSVINNNVGKKYDFREGFNFNKRKNSHNVKIRRLSQAEILEKQLQSALHKETETMDDQSFIMSAKEFEFD